MNLNEVILVDFVSSVELFTVLLELSLDRTIYSPFGAIIGSLSSELQSLKAELMLN